MHMNLHHLIKYKQVKQIKCDIKISFMVHQKNEENRSFLLLLSLYTGPIIIMLNASLMKI